LSKQGGCDSPWRVVCLGAIFTVRVRITQSPKGIVDGVHIGQLQVGLTYDLPMSLASLLIVEGWVEPEMATNPGETPHPSFSLVKPSGSRRSDS
jgi:hypothetical protein